MSTYPKLNSKDSAMVSFNMKDSAKNITTWEVKYLASDLFSEPNLINSKLKESDSKTKLPLINS